MIADEVGEADLIEEEASSGVGIALIILFAAILLMLLFLFRKELGIVIPDVDIAQPAEVPEGAMSVADQRREAARP